MNLKNASMPFNSHFLHPMVQILFCILKQENAVI